MVNVWDILDKRFKWIGKDDNGARFAYTHKPYYNEEVGSYMFDSSTIKEAMDKNEFIQAASLSFLTNVEFNMVSDLMQRPSQVVLATPENLALLDTLPSQEAEAMLRAFFEGLPDKVYDLIRRTVGRYEGSLLDTYYEMRALEDFYSELEGI